VGSFDHEPTVASPLTVEALTDEGWHSYPAWIVDLTRQELWVQLEHGLAASLDPGRSVRLAISHPERPTQLAETVVLWHIGKTGSVVALKRPLLWEPPSRRGHSRARLAVPVYIRSEDSSEPVPATSVDIGVGGFFCVVAMELRIGQRVDVSVQLTPNHPFECQAEVARLDEDADDPMGLQLSAGLQFLDLTHQDQAYLADAIARLSRDVDADFVPRPWRPGADGLPDLPVGNVSDLIGASDLIGVSDVIDAIDAATDAGQRAESTAGGTDDVLISIDLDERQAS